MRPFGKSPLPQGAPDEPTTDHCAENNGAKFVWYVRKEFRPREPDLKFGGFGRETEPL